MFVATRSARGLAFALFLIFLLGLSGCQRGVNAPSPLILEREELALSAETTFHSVYVSVLAPLCVDCHNPSGMATVSYNVQLNFSNKIAAYTSLIESQVNGANSAGTCGQVRIIEARDPEKSYLIGTLNKSYASGDFAGVANCRPYAGHYSIIHLSSWQQQELISWIQYGAFDN